jgi:hypothetical protein
MLSSKTFAFALRIVPVALLFAYAVAVVFDSNETLAWMNSHFPGLSFFVVLGGLLLAMLVGEWWYNDAEELRRYQDDDDALLEMAEAQTELAGALEDQCDGLNALNGNLGDLLDWINDTGDEAAWNDSDDEEDAHTVKCGHHESLGQQCKLPPKGWTCSRGAGHDGPCAAWPECSAPACTPPTCQLCPHEGKPNPVKANPKARCTCTRDETCPACIAKLATMQRQPFKFAETVTGADPKPPEEPCEGCDRATQCAPCFRQAVHASTGRDIGLPAAAPCVFGPGCTDTDTVDYTAPVLPKGESPTEELKKG